MTLPRKPARRGTSPYRVQVLDRVVAVLTALVEEGTEPASGWLRPWGAGIRFLHRRRDGHNGHHVGRAN